MGDDFAGDMGTGFEGGEGDEAGSIGAEGDQCAGAGVGGGHEPGIIEPRRMPNENDLVMALTDAGEEGGMLDYFDQNFLKNWAGPEHWKLRKVVRRRKSRLGPYFIP